MLDIKRREFIALVGGGGLLLTAKVRRARAQQPAMPVIGFLNSQSPGVYPPMAAAFHQGLEEIGFVEGQNVAIEYRWAQGRSDRLRALAAELVRRQVALIVAAGSSSALAAKARDHDASDRLLRSDRSCRGWTCCEPRPTGRQRHGRDQHERGAGAETGGDVARVGAYGDRHGRAPQPDFSRFREPIERPASGGPQARAATPCPTCQHRPRLRSDLCNDGTIASRYACYRC